MHNQQACHDLLAFMSEYVDGSLDEGLCAQLENHLKACEDCQIVVNTLKKTIELYQERGAEEQTKLPAEVRRRLFARLDLEDFIEKS